MKRFFHKIISKALVLSLAFHIFLLVGLSQLYRERVVRPQVPLSEISISEIRERLPVRRPKLPLHVPLETLSAAPQTSPSPSPSPSPQFQMIKVRSPNPFEPVTSRLHQETNVQFQIEKPSAPSVVRDRTYGGDSSLVPGWEGRGIGSGISAHVSGEGYRHPHQHFLSGSIEKTSADVAELRLPDMALTKIGKHIVASRTSNLVDIVFVIDGSGSMKNDINAVREHLAHMADLFDAAKLDFTIGVVAFRSGMGYALLGLDFEIIPQTRSIPEIQRILGKLRCSGDESTLDALIRAADEVRLRRHADVHFILVTDEYVSGDYSHTDVIMKMQSSKIRVDIIGRDEPSQKFIAARTGGVWLPISSLSIE